MENTDVINSHEATLHQVEDQCNKTDLSSPGDGIDRETNILESKLATSVSKILGVTPLVNTLDKARKALHKKETVKTDTIKISIKILCLLFKHKCLQPTKSAKRK